jgi:hypothetical protein
VTTFVFSLLNTTALMKSRIDTDMVLLRLQLPGHAPTLATATAMAMALDPAMATGTGTGTGTGTAAPLDSDTAPDSNTVMASAMDLEEGADMVLTSDAALGRATPMAMDMDPAMATNTGTGTNTAMAMD